MKEIPEWKKDTREIKNEMERKRLKQAKEQADETFKRFLNLTPPNDIWRSLVVSAMDTCNKCDASLLEFERELRLRRIYLDEKELQEQEKWKELHNSLKEINLK